MEKILLSKEDFEELKGNLTELVKITFDRDNIHRLNGIYLFERKNEKNYFFRKNPGSELIDSLLCETPHIYVRENLGISFNITYYSQEKISSTDKENYEKIKSGLSNFGLW